MISVKDIAWAAGFIEGEGSFLHRGRSMTVTASQVQVEPLLRLKRLFGGQINYHANRSEKTRWNAQPIARWCVNGGPAAAVAMTVYGLMSPRRKEQIEKALAIWKTGKGRRGRPAGFTRDANGREVWPEMNT